MQLYIYSLHTPSRHAKGQLYLTASYLEASCLLQSSQEMPIKCLEMGCNSLTTSVSIPSSHFVSHKAHTNRHILTLHHHVSEIPSSPHTNTWIFTEWPPNWTDIPGPSGSGEKPQKDTHKIMTHWYHSSAKCSVMKKYKQSVTTMFVVIYRTLYRNIFQLF